VSRVIVITGASRGVGLEAARRFVAKGWKVVGIARSRSSLEAARSALGPAFEYEAADVSRDQEVAKAFGAIRERHSVIDVLVNNAAVFKRAPFAACSPADIAAIIDTNLKGTMFCTLAALPLLRRPGGRIIHIASVAATHGIPEQTIYCASKFGVDGFAEALGQEVTSQGISVTTICPGGIDTPLWNAETNPYPGDLAKTLRSADVVQLVEMVADLPSHVVLKKVVTFPANEWH
jgi:NAD(P)-dependent dehydrogenase (short-subunit alcohol dehydrogenase family)